MATVKKRICKSCGSARCARILYGRIATTEKLQEALAAGEVVLGGCLFSKGMPQWRCLNCGQEWNIDSNKGINQK